MKDNLARLMTYLQSLPIIFKYQLFTKALLGIWLWIMGRLFRLLLNSTGRVAVTSGDFTFLFTTWQGILIILLALLSLFVYFALDLNAKIILSRDLLQDSRISLADSIKEAFSSLSGIMNLEGIAVILYITLLAPILGFGLSVSLTTGFYIPTFISSVIASTPLYLILVSFAVLLFMSFGIANLFILHGIILDGLPVKEAGRQSARLILKNRWDYLKQNILFILVFSAVGGLAVLVSLVLPLALIELLPLSAEISRFLTIFFMIVGVLLSVLTGLLITPLYLMKMTQLYYSYKDGTEVRYTGRLIHWQKADGAAILIALIASAGMSAVLYSGFDEYFPPESSVRIIAHRAGGIEGPENTAAGLDAAVRAGAWGSEIDIQRTKDGYYILNHDDNFQRVAGDSRKPGEMTLEEIRALSVDGEPVATYEESLAASSGRLILFTELKGESADKEMADYAVRTIREAHMEDEVVLISLKYDLIDYIEKTYPEIQTGFLTFASFGDTAKLNCDYIGFEEESATAYSIAAVHDQGKKVLVWTSNEKKSQKHFLCSKADGLITDNVVQAVEVHDSLRSRTDLQRMIDMIMQFFS